jgi:hypothetical protein
LVHITKENRSVCFLEGRSSGWRKYPRYQVIIACLFFIISYSNNSRYEFNRDNELVYEVELETIKSDGHHFFKHVHRVSVNSFPAIKVVILFLSFQSTQLRFSSLNILKYNQCLLDLMSRRV